MSNTIYGGSGGDPCDRSPVDRTVAYSVAPVKTRTRPRRDRQQAAVAADYRDECSEGYAPARAEAPARLVRAPRKGASAARWIVRILMLGFVVFGMLTVRYLTEQTVDQTSSLSDSAQNLTEYGAYLVQSGQSPSARADPVKWAAERILLVSYKLSAHGLGIRHQAHVIEFGLLGAVIAMNVLAWMSGWAHRRDASGRIHGWRTMLMFVLSVGLSAVASFADQYHKLSVPGRHFDAFDLVMDASGYLAAVIAVFVVWSIGSAVYRSVSRA